MSEADWEERYSNTHRCPYYFNVVTQKSQWNDPRPALRSALSATATATAPLPVSSSSSATASNASTTTATTSETLAAAAAASAIVEEEQNRKRSRHEETKSADVVTTSYQPPVSGSAQDSRALPEKKLPFPKITAALPHSNVSMWERTDIQVNPVLQQTYFDGALVDRNGVKQKFKDITNPLQARHIYNLVRDNRFTHTLEVGLAMGASACWITQAHKDNNLNGRHIAIDPNQTAQYEGIGKYLVEKCGTLQYLEVMEMTSYRALPILFERVRNGEIPKFDLIYIDGWHTFDYTLVDFFYADLLLNVHGVIVLDDIKHHPVKRCFDYIKLNYGHYKVVEKTPVYDPNDPKNSSQATFIKMANDSRTWNHHVDF